MTYNRHTLSSPPQTFNNNSFTSTMPTELGRLKKMTSYFRFHSNQLCDDVPTQVQAQEVSYNFETLHRNLAGENPVQ